MTKSRVLRTLAVVALVAAAIVALNQFDLLGLLRRLHGQA
jgi:hypothetical protein